MGVGCFVSCLFGAVFPPWLDGTNHLTPAIWGRERETFWFLFSGVNYLRTKGSIVSNLHRPDKKYNWRRIC